MQCLGLATSAPKAAPAATVPDPPKRALNAYMLYSIERRPALKILHPDMKPQLLMTTMGKEWKSMNSTFKKTWETAAVKAKEEYSKELAKYENQYGKIEKKKRTIKVDKKAMQAAKPKRPLSAYNVFYKEQFASARQELGVAAKVTEVAKVIGKRWKALSESGKQNYVNMAKAKVAQVTKPA